MVKTTIVLEDGLYKKLAKEAIDKYGSTRTLSKLINEKLKGSESMAEGNAGEKIDVVEKTAGMWKIKESGAEYVRKLRMESEKRFKRLGI